MRRQATLREFWTWSEEGDLNDNMDPLSNDADELD